MENTVKSAEEYLEWASHSLSNEDGDNPTQAEILYYYAKEIINKIRPAADVVVRVPSEKIYEIDFYGKLICKVSVSNNQLEIQAAADGWGDGIELSKIKIKRLNPTLTFSEGEK